MMADADYYREQSEFCVQMADAVADSQDKSRWLKLAQQWRELAEQGDGRVASRPQSW
jgi:3-methyladenine DNA glycosylase AlkC